MDERKILNDINGKIRMKLKEAISTPSKKTYVLLQAAFCGISFDSWELKKQQNEMITINTRIV
jgi:hypothetical protein